MKKVDVKLNRRGIGQLLKSDETKKMVKSYAYAQKDSEHHVKSFIGYDRARAIIYPNTKGNSNDN